MATQAISGLSMGLYRDDLTQSSVAFTQIALTGDALYQNYSSAAGYHYWDSTQTLLVEKQVHGAGGWVTVVPDYVWWTSGKVYFATPLNSDDLVRATGKKRSESNFIKVLNLTDIKLNPTDKILDITSVDSGGWEECLAGIKTWEGTAGMFFYYNAVSYPDIQFTDFLKPLYVKFYSNYSGSKAWGGTCQITNYSIIQNLKEAQKQTLTFKGDRELLPEL